MIEAITLGDILSGGESTITLVLLYFAYRIDKRLSAMENKFGADALAARQCPLYEEKRKL